MREEREGRVVGEGKWKRGWEGEKEEEERKEGRRQGDNK